MPTTHHTLRDARMPGVEATAVVTVHNGNDPLTDPITITPGETAIVIKINNDPDVARLASMFEIVAASDSTVPGNARHVADMLEALIPLLYTDPED